MEQRDQGLTGLRQADGCEPRTAWPNEAHDFTPWLAENLDRLSEATGVDLDAETTEAPVRAVRGRHSCDGGRGTVGADRESARVVGSLPPRSDPGGSQRPALRLLASASFALLLAFPGTTQAQEPVPAVCSHARVVAGWLSGLGPQPDYAAGTLTRLADLITDPRFEARTADENFRAQVAAAWYQATMRSGMFELWEATRAATGSAVAEAALLARDAALPAYDSAMAVLEALRDSVSVFSPTYQVALEQAEEAIRARREAEGAAVTTARTAANRVASAAAQAVLDTYAREQLVAAVFAADAAGTVVVDRANEIVQGRTPNTGVVNNGFLYGAATAAALAAAVTEYDAEEWFADRLADPRWAEGFADGVEAIANLKIAELRDCERVNP